MSNDAVVYARTRYLGEPITLTEEESQGSSSAVYARISRDPGNDALGVKRQEHAAKAWIEERGLAYARSYVDNDISGSDRKRRPAFEELLADVESGAVKTIVVYAVDRLTRSNTTLERLIEVLERNGCVVHSLTSGPLDLASPAGRMQARILGSVAQYERDAMLMRLAAQKDEQAKQGAWFGGAAPFGYGNARTEDGTPTLVVIEEEAKYVRRWIVDVIEGKTLRSIEEAMNASTVPPLRGKRWRYGSIRNLLVNPAIAGLQLHRGKVIGVGIWEPLVDPVVWEEARAILSDPSRKHRSPHKYLLSGMVEDAAGNPCVPAPVKRAGGKHVESYKFKGGSVEAAYAEDVVVAALFAQIESNRMPIVPLGESPQRKADNDELRRINEELLALAKNQALPVDDLDRLTAIEVQTMRRPLRERQLEIQRRLATHRTAPAAVAELLANPQAIPGAWESGALSFELKRQLLAAAIERVVLYPKGHDPRVEVVAREE